MGAGQVRTAQAQRESGGASRKTVSAMPETKSPSDPLREAQQFLGNQGILKRLQAKLTVNQPGDVYEQEADRVADAVMAKPAGMAAVDNSIPAFTRIVGGGEPRTGPTE